MGAAVDAARALGATGVTAWPAVDGTLTARLILPAGDCAARYLATAADARAWADEVPGTVADGRWVLHPGGVDAKLATLASRTAARGVRLVGHRVGRRAVLRTATGDFTKVVPRRRQPALLAASRAAAALPLRTPAVLAADADTVTVAGLPGVALHDLVRVQPAQRLVDGLRAVGAAVAELHRLPAPVDAARHDAAAERAVLNRWQTLAADWGAPTDDRPLPSPPETGAPVPLHRDLHDKQLLVDGDDVGLIDFDLAAVGDPALDLANLLVHLEWRERQGLCADSEPLRQALIDGYRPSRAVRSAVPFWSEMARRRLRAVYHFRTSAPR